MAFGRASTMLTAMYTPSLILIIHYGYSIADTIQMDKSSSDSPGRGGRGGVDNEKTVSGIIFRQDARSGGDGSFTESQVTPAGTVMMEAGGGEKENLGMVRMTVTEVV